MLRVPPMRDRLASNPAERLSPWFRRTRATAVGLTLGLLAVAGHPNVAPAIGAGRSIQAPGPEAAAEHFAPDLLLVVTEGSAVRDSGLGRAVHDLLGAIGSDEPAGAGWQALADELGYSHEDLFDRLLGGGFALALVQPATRPAQSADAGSTQPDRGAPPAAPGRWHWALVAHISPETFQRLRERLRPAPRSVIGESQVLSLERGRYELAARPIRSEIGARPQGAERAGREPAQAIARGSRRTVRGEPDARTVEIVLAPVDRSAVFDRLVRARSPLTGGGTSRLNAVTPSGPTDRLSELRAMVADPAPVAGAERGGAGAGVDETGPTVRLAGRASAMSLIPIPLTNRAADAQGDRRTAWPELRITLRRTDATDDTWAFTSALAGQVTAAGTNAPDGTGATGPPSARLAAAWSPGAVVALLAGDSPESDRLLLPIGQELLNQMAVGPALRDAGLEHAVVGVRLDAAPAFGPERTRSQDAQGVGTGRTVPPSPPSVSILLRLGELGEPLAMLDRTMHDLARTGTPKATDGMLPAGFAPGATRTVSLAPPADGGDPDGAAFASALTWTMISPEVQSRATPLAVITLTPAATTERIASAETLHRELRSALDAGKDADAPAGEPDRWHVTIRPARLASILPESTPIAHRIRNVMAGIEFANARFFGPVPTADATPAGPATVRGEGELRFVLPPADPDPPPQSAPAVP